jgi:hypothetical protein
MPYGLLRTWLPYFACHSPDPLDSAGRQTRGCHELFYSQLHAIRVAEDMDFLLFLLLPLSTSLSWTTNSGCHELFSAQLHATSVDQFLGNVTTSSVPSPYPWIFVRLPVCLVSLRACLCSCLSLSRIAFMM